MSSLQYISHYPQHIKDQALHLVEHNKLSDYLLNKYPTIHPYVNNKTLREYCVSIKNRYLKKSSPLSSVVYDPKIHVINNALGLHSYVSRNPGK